MQEPAKTSLMEQMLKPRGEENRPGALKAFVPAPPIEAANVSLAPDFREEQGVLARWRAKQMDRKSALAVLETKYAGHLDVVKHNVLEQVKVGKVQISVRAEEMLKELDAKHLEIVAYPRSAEARPR